MATTVLPLERIELVRSLLSEVAYRLVGAWNRLVLTRALAGEPRNAGDDSA